MQKSSMLVLVNERPCKECGQIVAGRSDKLFCSDHCRSSYNNRLNSYSTGVIRNTNNILKKNWRILSELNQEGTTKIKRDMLVSRGFSFDYITSTYTNRSNQQYRYCYDQGYMILKEDRVLLVEKVDEFLHS